MTAPASSPSDAPQRQVGTRTRSGNAMLRTRAAILEAAAGCVQRFGVRKTTMGDVAAQGGVAKATLYNHFRTKDDVLRALVDARVAELGERCAATAAERGLA
ncbi:MAG: transcriptional regulator, TetR family, partial [Frankiales bacterium]|nr:transcriptional regulator, TetR family [Frankiales bacterium]